MNGNSKVIKLQTDFRSKSGFSAKIKRILERKEKYSALVHMKRFVIKFVDNFPSKWVALILRLPKLIA